MGKTERNPRLMFVDDDAMVRRLFARTARRRGFEVDLASSALEALRLAQNRFYPVIITDLRMPGMDGLTLIERLRPTYPNTAFVVVTGMPDLDLRRNREVDEGIVCIVKKPWDPDELMASVSRAFELHRKRYLRMTSSNGNGNGRSSVLLIEDNPADADLVIAYLDHGGGPRVRHITRLSLALELLHEESFDTVLADLTLPDARGLDAVARLHTAAPETAIIVLTGHDDEDLALQAVQMGAQDYLVKGHVDSQLLFRSLRYAQERKQAEQRLAHLAHYDQLTGLANRVTLQDRIGVALARSRRLGTQFAVMFLDLDQFKAINDSLGHDAGDALLQEVGRRVRTVVREYDTVARIGGDEFAVVLDDVEGVNGCADVANRVLRGVAQPFEIDGTELSVTTSIGLALFPEAADTVEELLKCADTAMYSAKERGRNTFQIFTPQQRVDMLPRLRTLTSLQGALERGEFLLHYQPLVEPHTNEIRGMEALLRWRQQGELLSPGHFIPLLEETGYIVPVGAWVLESACTRLARWRAAGATHLRMSVNVSARQFEEEDLVDAVVKALETSAMEPDALEPEITESILMTDTRRTNTTLAQLKELGVRLAIDDFGAGYSSLAYLSRFSVDTLKIDRSFVSAAPNDPDSLAIASAIVALGHRLGLSVVAEGVETRAQLHIVRREGCDLVQGFLLGKPRAHWGSKLVGSPAEH